MRSPSVAIIVPMLNERSVVATVDALVPQRVGKARPEIIVVGRDDNCYVRRRPEVTFIETERPVFAGAARNIGAQSTGAELLLFADSDVAPSSGGAQRLVNWLGAQDCAVSAAVAIRRQGYWAMATNVAMLHEFLDTAPAGTRPYLASFAFGVRHSTFDRVHGFDPALRSAQDIDFFIRLRAAGAALVFDPTTRVRHVQAIASFSAVFRKFRTYGGNSIRVRLRHPDTFQTPRAMRDPRLLRLGGPAIAAWVTLRVFGRSPALARYLHAAPVVYASKLAWCVGAANALESDRTARASSP